MGIQGLEGKHIVLGVTGSIAAYKAVEIARQLTLGGALVDVILTKAAQEFVTPLTFRSLTHRPVVTELFDPEAELSVEHVRLAERADAVLVAPATADAIAKLAHGIAEDMLGCTVLATLAPVLIAPAMNVNMYQSAITQENLDKLRARGCTIIGPAYGPLATGLVGTGRLAELEEILGTLGAVLGRGGDLAGKSIVVTAGGTQEALDPVRYITNRSSGRMGYALAEAARDRGARVTLVSAPTALVPPAGVHLVPVRSATQMRDAVFAALPQADALIMAAAVADFQVSSPSPHKIKKADGGLMLELVPTPDILAEVAQERAHSPQRSRLVVVGFAAESQDLLANAQAKLRAKDLDLIVANDITATDAGFEVETNRVTILSKDGKSEALPLMTKLEVAHHLLDRVRLLLEEGDPTPTLR